MFTTLQSSNWNTSNLSAPQLDWATFQKYIAPAIRSGDVRGVNRARDQWASQLGWNTGGKGNFLIEGLDRDKFFMERTGQVNQGYGDNAGSESLAAMEAALANPENQRAWAEAVNKAMSDPNTIYRVIGDRLTNVDGSAATNEGARRQVRYQLKDGKLVPIAQFDSDRASTWADIRDEALPIMAAVLGGGYLAGQGLGTVGAGEVAAGNGAFLGEGVASGVGAWDSAAGLGGAAAGAGGGYIPANAAGSVGGVGSPASTAGYNYGQMAGSLSGSGGGTTGGINGYLTTGGAEGSIMGNGITGAGGAAGAVGPGTTANLLGTAANWLGGSNALGIPNWVNLGGNLLNSYLGYNASQNAVDAQLRGAAEANALQRYMFDTIRKDNLPALDARNAGLAGYRNLLANPGGVTSTPGYGFRLQQGQNAYDNSGAARGMRLSGAQAKALTRFGQNFATNELDNALNRFGNMAGLGQVGAGTIANAGQNYANQAGQNITGAGNAAASGYIGGANAIAGGVNNFLRNWQESNLLRQLGIGG